MNSFRYCTALILLIMILPISAGAFDGRPTRIDATDLLREEVREVTRSLRREPGVRSAKQYKVGDSETFWTRNLVTNAFEQIEAVLEARGRHCYVFVESGRQVSSQAIENLRHNFDDIIYPTVRKNFGTEFNPGVDGDPRIFLLLHDIKDGYQGSGGFVAGYYYAVDSYKQSSLPDHIKSNEREMLYLDIDPADPSTVLFLDTVAHEFQHMVHSNQDKNEYTWVDESCAMLASYLCGYGHASQLFNYKQTPDNSLTAWSPARMLANYGQVYLWNYYVYSNVLQNFSEDERAKFFIDLVASQKQGIAGYAEALRKTTTSFTWSFVRFCIANFVNDKALGDGRYAYDNSLAHFRLPHSDQITTFPAKIEAGVYLWSADAIKIDLTNAREQIQIDFEGFRGKMGYDLYNEFSVVLVLSDSSLNAQPSMTSLTVKDISNTKQGGTIKISPESNYDMALLIIIAHAPEEIDDIIYTKARPMNYKVQISDSGSRILRQSAKININNELTNYANNAANLDQIADSSSVAIAQLENTRRKINAGFISHIEQNNISELTEFVDLLNSHDKATVAPIAQSIRQILKFQTIINNTPLIEKIFNSIEATE